ncbi:unnamed protein product [Cuscuta epithymum]|uniref:non-specific serine/threonine protein kinase n=2 Tax=Cuscuta epithymum TaxID=186058 RepID=A0AAV0FDA1_9ASTE|nr:unnamed protein product [Cuscuta epithymum]
MRQLSVLACFAVVVFLTSINSHGLNLNQVASARRSLLSSTKKTGTALVAALDGTIHLFDLSTKRPLWSFTSGSPIYCAYQAHNDKESTSDISNGYFIDIGTEDDWELYAHNGPEKLKLKKSIEAYVSATPQVAEDGGVVLGSRRSSVFQVEAKTGSRISTYTMLPDYPANSGRSVNLKSALYITRTDYSLTSFALNSNKVVWNVSVAEIGAAFLCQGFDDPTDFNMPLPCNSWAPVHRFRGHNLLECLSTPNCLLNVILLSSHYTDKYSNNHREDGPRIKGISQLINNGRFSVFVLIVFAAMLVGTIFQHYILGHTISLWGETAPPKKKKSNKSAKIEGNGGEKDAADIETGNKMLLNLNHPTSHNADGRTIGKLFVFFDKEIGKGSNGTIVLEGIYQGRPVAVKRLVRAHHDIAFKEMQNLIASDQHPNIVRWYGVEQDQDFVYMALERCICSLDDLIQICSLSSQNSNNDTKRIVDPESMQYRIRLDSLKLDMQGIKLCKENGYPSATLLKLMRDVVCGLIHLHELGIIHRDLKPQNVLITKERVLCAKVSDMGISKRLIGDMSSLGHHATGYGSSGWQAPELLLQGRQTRALDLFSLGCVLFHCITGGCHPFGNPLERDINITKNRIDLFLVNHMPEAVELLSGLLDPNAEMRPNAGEVLAHPFFWTSETRLAFLRDTSDRVEVEDRDSGSVLLKALELEGTSVCAWDSKLDPALLHDIARYRRYQFHSVRDLLRLIRNKSNHYRQLPTEVQELLGPLPEGFDAYFTSRFPRLLIQVYKVVSSHCRKEEFFHKYFSNSTL